MSLQLGDGSEESHGHEHVFMISDLELCTCWNQWVGKIHLCSDRAWSKSSFWPHLARHRPVCLETSQALSQYQRCPWEGIPTGCRLAMPTESTRQLHLLFKRMCCWLDAKSHSSSTSPKHYSRWVCASVYSELWWPKMVLECGILVQNMLKGVRLSQKSITADW